MIQIKWTWNGYQWIPTGWIVTDRIKELESQLLIYQTQYPTKKGSQ